MDIIRGAYDKPVSTGLLIRTLEKTGIEGTLYTGYPIVGIMESKSSIDAVLISRNHGMLIFDIVEESEVSERQALRDSLYNAMASKMLTIRGLSQGRGALSFQLDVVTFAPAWHLNKVANQEVITTPESLVSFVKQKDGRENAERYSKVLEAIQAITRLKQRTPRQTTSSNSKGAILNEVEKSISNLDRNQSKAVIETSAGIQRIRGLAGSGKTVILALKTAYLHSKYPEWKIGVTFYTRSLKNQFRDLINKFTIEQKNEEPDWDRVKIMQAWGSPANEGVYYNFCKANGITFHNLDTAKAKYGADSDLLGEISAEAIGSVTTPREEFDAILIDEAQDFSESFLKLCYKLLKSSDTNNPHNKRLVYAYDELQKLSELSLRSPREIFGHEIDFANVPDKPLQDIILKVCYRNSAPVLITAHGLGFGIYRQGDADVNLVTMFREKELWGDVGYKVVGGELKLGGEVELARDKNTSPELMPSAVTKKEIVQFHTFEDSKSQDTWIAEQVEKNLKEDDLEHRDIIVIHPDAYRSKSETSHLRALLVSRGINCHLAGISTSADEFFIDQSVAFTSIFRAKGNEAAMVYVMNTEYCFGGPELIKKRNILFTAITRSKGWVRACGLGDDMKKLTKEFHNIESNSYHLKFRYPTAEQMNKLNVIHRELTPQEKRNIEQGNDEAKSLLEKLQNDEIKKEDLSKEVIEQLRRLLDERK